MTTFIWSRVKFCSDADKQTDLAEYKFCPKCGKELIHFSRSSARCLKHGSFFALLIRDREVTVFYPRTEDEK